MIPGFGAGDHFFALPAHCWVIGQKVGKSPRVTGALPGPLTARIGSAGGARRLLSGGTLTRTRRGRRARGPESRPKPSPRTGERGTSWRPSERIRPPSGRRCGCDAAACSSSCLPVPNQRPTVNQHSRDLQAPSHPKVQSLATPDLPHTHWEADPSCTRVWSYIPIVWHVAVHCLDTVWPPALMAGAHCCSSFSARY